MLKFAWTTLALVALGLWASLIPQVTYPSSSTGAPEGDVLTAWPGWSVQQELGPVTGTVGTFRIWISADPTAFTDVTLDASLIDASTREVLRQTLLTVSRRYIPAAHTVTFPGYAIPLGQRLMLQLGVPEAQKRHVIYRLANPAPEHANIRLNGIPDAAEGPLALAQLRTGSGLRAALEGEESSRLRLILGLAAAALALLAHPRALRRLRPTASRIGRGGALLRARIGRLVKIRVGGTTRTPPSRLKRVLEAPWYPWPATTVPILHYLASNPLHFAVNEALVPLAVGLVAVTVLVVALHIGFKDWHRAAALCTAVVVVFFGYGHADRVIEGRLDDRLVFGLAVVLVASIAVLIVRSGAAVARPTPFLNFTTAVLLVFPAASVALEAARATAQSTSSAPASVKELAAHLLPAGIPEVSGRRPDIYYIILDAYARDDTLFDLYGFDNSDFLRALEKRGFYIVRKATSNYNRSVHSIPSSLNLSYLDALGSRIPTTHDELINVTRTHALGAILKNLGYKYIHLSSGFVSTDSSPLADQIVDFTPAGTLVRPGAENGWESLTEQSLLEPSYGFIRGLVQTTILEPIVGDVLSGNTTPYEWHSSLRALRMFEFLSNRTLADHPRFVLAHILKPHVPATLDQHGNYLDGDPGFDDSHDPSVPNAYIGQLIYVNKLVMRMIDSILESGSEPPIIVLAADHGYSDDRHFEYLVRAKYAHSILNAVYMPHGGEDGMYPSMSLVNVFRHVLDYYFSMEVGLVEDKVLELEPNHYDFGRP